MTEPCDNCGRTDSLLRLVHWDCGEVEWYCHECWQADGRGEA